MITRTAVVDVTNPVWYKALTLKERALLLQKMSLDGNLPKTSLDTRIIAKRLERWRNEPVFQANPEYLERYLSLYGLTEASLVYLLSQTPVELQTAYGETPQWLLDLDTAYTDHTSEQPLFFLEEDHLAQLPVDAANLMRFLHLVEPVIRQGWRKLHQKLDVYFSTQPQAAIFPALDYLLDSLVLNLTAKLIETVTRALLLEINIARMNDALEGETPEVRFRNFLLNLRDPQNAVAILEDYPVMARLVVNYTESWIETNFNMIQRLAEDWEMLQEVFGLKDAGQIAAVEGGAGDTHRGGESVHIFTFTSGAKLVYKPRSLNVDEHFQKLLAWFEERGSTFDFRLLKLLNRGTYGWVEYVNYQEASKQDDIFSFYMQQGGYLALLYLLHATDFHSENLIASGKHPVLVDLEALFHPMVWVPTNSDVNLLVNRVLSNSVFSIGLLPRRMYVSDDLQDGIEMSGLGGEGGQLTPHNIPTWEGLGTDEMRFIRKKVQLAASQNQPRLNGEVVKLLDYETPLIDGFSQMYQALMDHRDELLKEDSPLSAFGDDEVRHLVRETRSYALRLLESYHPNLLQDSLRRERFLGNVWVNLQYNPLIEPAIPHELNDLLAGDIPSFYTKPNSRDLLNSAGEVVAKDCFEQSGLDIVRKRLEEFNPKDLSRNLWFIRSSFTALIMGEDSGHFPSYAVTPTEASATPDQLIEEAKKIGDYLVDMVLTDPTDTSNITWLGLRLMNERVWTLDAAGLDFYNGLTGIAHFLAYLGDITGEKQYHDLALSALQTTRKAISMYLDDEALASRVRFTIGAFGELGGAIYTLAHFGKLYDMPELWEEAERIASRLQIEDDQVFDVISGTAGALMSLLALYDVYPSQKVLEIAKACGDHLLKNSIQTEDGVGWMTTEMSESPLSGFSHGVAGVGLSLLRLSAITGDERYKETARLALQYERSLFVPEKHNWLDLRNIYPDQADENFMVAWCHGAPGIGIARLEAMEYLPDDPKMVEEVNAAIETTIQQGFGRNHCICHGDIGNLELLLNASIKLNDEQLRQNTYQIAEALLQTSVEHGWLCGVPLGVQTPGLMYGMAGIGYGLLRLAKPDHVPSLLAVASPKGRQA